MVLSVVVFPAPFAPKSVTTCPRRTSRSIPLSARIRALNGIDLEVRRGQVVTLLGANGAGKTTTLRTISGLVPAKAGSIVLDGQEITGLRASDIARLGVVHVPEGRHILKGLS